MKNCFKCNGKLEPAVKLINHKGKTAIVNTLKCVKCDKTYTHIDEVEKARLNLNTSFFGRIKEFFSVGKVTEAIVKGKVL